MLLVIFGLSGLLLFIASCESSGGPSSITIVDADVDNNDGDVDDENVDVDDDSFKNFVRFPSKFC